MQLSSWVKICLGALAACVAVALILGNTDHFCLVVLLIGISLAGLLLGILQNRLIVKPSAADIRFEKLVQTLPYGVVVTQGQFVAFANPRGAQVFRYPNPQSMVGASIWKMVDPEFHAMVRRRIGELERGPAGHWMAEMRCVAFDGTTFDAEATNAAVDFEGRPARLVVIRDITAAKQMERRSREQLHDLSLLHEVSRALLFGLGVDQIPDYLCALIVERLGVCTAWLGLVSHVGASPVVTPKVVKGIAGSPEPDLYDHLQANPGALAIANAKPVFLDLHSDPRAAAWRDWADERGYRSAASFPLISSDHVIAVLNVFSADADFFTPERAALLQSLANLAAIALSESQALEDLRRRAADLEHALEAGHMGVYDLDLLTGRMTSDPHYTELFGLRPDQYDGTYQAIAHQIHLDDAQEVERVVDAALADKSVYEHEFRIVWPDGSVHWVASRGRFVYDEAGRPVRMTGVVMDVDRRRTAEQTARQQHNQLAHLLRLNLLSQFASGLAHEINQPLAAISYFAGAAMQLREDAKLTPDRTREVLGEIHQQAQRAGEIIRRLRGFMKKREPDEEVTCGLNAVIGEAIAFIGPELQRAQVRANFTAAPNLPQVRIDPVQIQQVLVNLIQNAIDAMEETPARQRLLTISTVPSVEQIIVRVSDAGRGIPAADVSRVFDSFYSTKAHGLGMGLNISRSIVESHGGRLTAHNNSQGGATFEFLLPLGGEITP